jgi:hypothetical protein
MLLAQEQVLAFIFLQQPLYFPAWLAGSLLLSLTIGNVISCRIGTIRRRLGDPHRLHHSTEWD